MLRLLRSISSILILGLCAVHFLLHLPHSPNMCCVVLQDVNGMCILLDFLEFRRLQVLHYENNRLFKILLTFVNDNSKSKEQSPQNLAQLIFRGHILS